MKPYQALIKATLLGASAVSSERQKIGDHVYDVTRDGDLIHKKRVMNAEEEHAFAMRVLLGDEEEAAELHDSWKAWQHRKPLAIPFGRRTVRREQRRRRKRGREQRRGRHGNKATDQVHPDTEPDYIHEEVQTSDSAAASQLGRRPQLMLYVRLQQGAVDVLSLPFDATLSDLKRQVAAMTNIDVNELSLSFQGTELNVVDTTPLADTGLSNEAMIAAERRVIIIRHPLEEFRVSLGEDFVQKIPDAIWHEMLDIYVQRASGGMSVSCRDAYPYSTTNVQFRFKRVEDLQGEEFASDIKAVQPCARILFGDHAGYIEDGKVHKLTPTEGAEDGLCIVFVDRKGREFKHPLPRGYGLEAQYYRRPTRPVFRGNNWYYVPAAESTEN